jgi:hypothetical protein
MASSRIPKLTVQTVVPSLRQHFYRATVSKSYGFIEQTEEEVKLAYEN